MNPLHFKIETKPYGKKVYKKSSLTIEDKITVFVGPNGYGKTTLIDSLKSYLKANNFREIDKNPKVRHHNEAMMQVFKIEKSKKIYMSYDPNADSYARNLDYSAFASDWKTISIRTQSSEGENNILSFKNLFNQAKIVAKDGYEQIILFIDGIDSGLSVDMINLILDMLEESIKSIEEEGSEVAVIFTTNNYEMCRNRKVIDARTFDEIEYKTYEDFRKDMLKKSVNYKQQPNLT